MGLRFRPTSCRPLLSNPYGPPGNRNAKKHGGLYAGDARRIDMRTREDNAVFQTFRAIEDDLAELSPQRRLILEGIVAKWKAAPYRPDIAPFSWIKIKNPGYSQARDRAELFDR